MHPQNWRVNPHEAYVRIGTNLEVTKGSAKDRLFVRTNWHLRRMRRQYEIDDFIYSRHDELVITPDQGFKFVKRFIVFPERCVQGRMSCSPLRRTRHRRRASSSIPMGALACGVS